MCAIQYTTSQKDRPQDQTENDHNSQGIAFGLLSMVAGNDGVQQVVDIAAMNLWYDKLHTTP